MSVLYESASLYRPTFMPVSEPTFALYTPCFVQLSLLHWTFFRSHWNLFRCKTHCLPFYKSIKKKQPANLCIVYIRNRMVYLFRCKDLCNEPCGSAPPFTLHERLRRGDIINWDSSKEEVGLKTSQGGGCF